MTPDSWSMDADILEVDAEYAGFDWEAEEAAEVAGVDEGLSVSDVVGRIEELVAEIVQVSWIMSYLMRWRQ